ncbi:MAG: hypothetical protein RL095_2773 [Verrucomicrobiota bacterium]
MIEISWIRVLHRVAELGTVSAAARSLGVTQSAASQILTKLEKQAGLKLLERSRGRVDLTEAGRELALLADPIFVQEELLIKRLQEMRQVDDLQLQVGAGQTFGDYYLPTALRQFSRQYPAQRLETRMMATSDLEKALLRGACHLAFSSVSPVDPRLSHKLVAEERVVALVPPDHRLAKLKYADEKDFDGELFLQHEGGSGMSFVLGRIRERHPGIRLYPGQNASNEAIMAGVEAGDGIALMSERASARQVASGRLVALPIGIRPLRRNFYALHLKEQKPSEPALRLIRIVQELFLPVSHRTV